MKYINPASGKTGKNSLQEEKLKKAKKILQKMMPVLIVATAVVLIALTVAIFSGGNSVSRFIRQGDTSLKSSDGRVNVLLLGIAGGMHDGAQLTDTIMVASFDLKNKKINLISLPRDFWLKQTSSKINAAYEIGEAKGNGLNFAQDEIGRVLGTPIQYGVRVDFGGFVKAVDLMGGLDVNVERSFDDYNYPIEGRENDLCGYTEEEKDFNPDEASQYNIEPGKHLVLISPDGKIATDSADPVKGAQYFSCRFEHISFKAGQTHMDGATALKFVRSRKGTNDEGTDFARSKRQQKVLEAFRSKALSLDTLANPQKVSSLITTFGKSIDTNISVSDALEFYRLVKQTQNINSFVIDDSDALGLLINPPYSDYGGAYVLIPRQGVDNYNSIQKYVKKILSGEVTTNEATAAARPSRN